MPFRHIFLALFFSHRPIVASPSSKRGSVSVLGGSVLFVFMFSIFERVLEAKGAGWSLLRYGLILGPAILALIVLNTAFRLD